MKNSRTFNLTLDCNASEPRTYVDVTPRDSYKESVYLYSLGDKVCVPVELIDSIFNAKVHSAHHLDLSMEFCGQLVECTVQYRSFITGLLSPEQFLPCYSLVTNDGSSLSLLTVPEFLILPFSSSLKSNPLRGLFFAFLSSYDLYGEPFYDKYYYLLSLKGGSSSLELKFLETVPSMYAHLTPHFRLSEFLSSSYEDSTTLYDSLTPEIVNNMRLLCGSLLEPLREYLGFPVCISSGFRIPSLNTKVGGAITSYHLQGRAADIYIPYKYSHLASLDRVYNFLSKLSPTELIQYDTFIHVAL